MNHKWKRTGPWEGSSIDLKGSRRDEHGRPYQVTLGWVIVADAMPSTKGLGRWTACWHRSNSTVHVEVHAHRHDAKRAVELAMLGHGAKCVRDRHAWRSRHVYVPAEVSWR